MDSYQDLLKQKAALDQQIVLARQREIDSALATVRSLVQQFGLTEKQVFASSNTRQSTAGVKVAPKYRDPATGATWTGRGVAPRWIADQRREDFLIK